MRMQMTEGVSLPCFSSEAVDARSLLWLPVAPACNMQCIVCARQTGRAADPLAPGGVLPPEDAVAHAASRIEQGEEPSGALLWGPGEPLANASTYVVLRKLQWSFPDLPVTVGTNGILLPERLEELVRAGVRHIVVSINAVKAATAALIYGSVNFRARRYTGMAAAELALQQQWNGLENAVEAGVSVTVYTAVMDGINTQEVGDISERAREIGAERTVTAVVPAEGH